MFAARHETGGSSRETPTIHDVIAEVAAKTSSGPSRLRFVKFNFAAGVDTAEQDAYGELSASEKIPRSSEIQTVVAQRVKDFCLTKYNELGRWQSP